MRGPGQAGSLPRCESKIFTTENTEGTEKSGYNPLYELWLALGPVMTRAEQLESLSVESAATEPPRKPEKTARLVSMDAFRGTVMTLMLAEQMRLPEVARSFPNNPIWNVIAYNTQHVEWQGCSLHDLIQPAFSFLVGTALPFSIASRTRKGQTFPQMLGHTIWRAFLLSYWESFCVRCVRLKPTSHSRTRSPRSDWDTSFCLFWDSRGCERKSSCWR